MLGEEMTKRQRKLAKRIRRALAASREIQVFNGSVSEIDTAYPVPEERLIVAFMLTTGDHRYRVSLRKIKPAPVKVGDEVWLAGSLASSELIELWLLVNLTAQWIMFPYDAPAVPTRIIYGAVLSLAAAFLMIMYTYWPEVLFSHPLWVRSAFGMLLLLLFCPTAFAVHWRRRPRLVRCDDDDWRQLLKVIHGAPTDRIAAETGVGPR